MNQKTGEALSQSSLPTALGLPSPTQQIVPYCVREAEMGTDLHHGLEVLLLHMEPLCCA